MNPNKIEKILEKKRFGKNTFYLVKWIDQTYEEATWEPKSFIIEAKDALCEFKTSHPIDKIKAKISKYQSIPEKRLPYEKKLRFLLNCIATLAEKKQLEVDKQLDREEFKETEQKVEKKEDKLLTKKRNEEQETHREEERSPDCFLDWVGEKVSEEQSTESDFEINEISKEMVMKTFLVTWKPSSDGSKKEPSYITEIEMAERYPAILANYYGKISEQLARK